MAALLDARFAYVQLVAACFPPTSQYTQAEQTDTQQCERARFGDLGDPTAAIDRVIAAGHGPVQVQVRPQTKAGEIEADDAVVAQVAAR